MATISSNNPNKIPNVHKKYLILAIKDKRICPALMFASNRKHKVIGRTRILTNSTIPRKGDKYQGEFSGRRDAIELLFKLRRETLINHIKKATLKFNPKVVVTGYL
jgi:hypothetical protein